MKPVFAAQRRAEEFDSLVEGELDGALARNAELLELAELVGAMRAAPRPVARAEFVADLRERLMAEAETALAPSALEAHRRHDHDSVVLNGRLTVAPRRTARERRLAAVVGGLAIVGASTSVAAASQSALPGDVLYPVKRALENAGTGFSVSDSQKGSALLSNARGRLDEVDALSRDGAEGAEATAVAQTLAAFADQAREASDLLIADFHNNQNEAAITDLRDFTAESMQSLAALEAVVPEGARAALITAAQVLTQIDTAAQTICPSCGGEGIAVLPPFVTASVERVLDGLATALDTDSTERATSTNHRAADGKQARRAGDGRPAVPEVPEVPEGEQPPGSVTRPPSSPIIGDGTGTGTGTGPGGSGGDVGGVTVPVTGGSGGDLPTAEEIAEGVGHVIKDVTGMLLGGEDDDSLLGGSRP